MDIDFSIYLATPTRWVHLRKTISFPTVPRKGEFVKFRNEKLGDYFAFEVMEVTNRESGQVEIQTDLLDNVDQRMYSFEEEEEFDEYFQSYRSEGWRCERGVVPNKRVAGKRSSSLKVPNTAAHH